MIKRNIKFQYFYLVRQKAVGNKWKGLGKLDIAVWMDKVDKHQIKNTTIDLGDAKANIDKIECDDDGNMWSFRFMKLREDNIPSIVRENQEAEAIKLDSDEYIGEGLHMLYDNETGIAMLQVNRFSLGLNRLEALFSTIWNEENERIRLISILDKKIFDAWPRRCYRKIEIGFANITSQLEEGKNSLGTIMNLYRKFQGVSGNITISLGKTRRGTLNIDEVKEVVSDAMKDSAVGTLKLHVKDDDDRPVEVIDLFDEVAKDIIKFTLPEKTALEYSYAILEMKNCYKARKEYLKGLINLK